MSIPYHNLNLVDTTPTRAGGDADAGSTEEWRRRGFTQVENSVLRDAQSLSPMARLTYTVLRSWGWQDEVCWPGMERLVQDIGRAEKRVREYIKELEDAGLIVKKRRGQGQTNTYRFMQPANPHSCPERTPGSDLERPPPSVLVRTPGSGYEDAGEEDTGRNTSPRGCPPEPSTSQAPENDLATAETPCPTSPAMDRDTGETTHTASGERGSEVGLVRDAVKDLVRGVEAGGGSILKSRKNRYAGEVKRLVEEEGVGREELEKVVARVVARYPDIPLSAEAALEDVRNGRGLDAGGTTAQGSPPEVVEAIRSYSTGPGYAPGDRVGPYIAQCRARLAGIAERWDFTDEERDPPMKLRLEISPSKQECDEMIVRLRKIARRAVKEAQVEASEGSSQNAPATIHSEGLEDAPEGSTASGSAVVRERLPGAPRDEVLGSVLNDRSGWVHDEVLDYLAGGTTSRKLTELVATVFGLEPDQQLDDRVKLLLNEMEEVPA